MSHKDNERWCDTGTRSSHVLCEASKRKENDTDRGKEKERGKLLYTLEKVEKERSRCDLVASDKEERDYYSPRESSRSTGLSRLGREQEIV